MFSTIAKNSAALAFQLQTLAVFRSLIEPERRKAQTISIVSRTLENSLPNITQGEDDNGTLYNGDPFWLFMLNRFPDFLSARAWAIIETELDSGIPAKLQSAKTTLSRAIREGVISWVLLRVQENSPVGICIPIEDGTINLKTTKISYNNRAGSSEFPLMVSVDSTNFKQINPQNLTIWQSLKSN